MAESDEERRGIRIFEALNLHLVRYGNGIEEAAPTDADTRQKTTSNERRLT